MARPKPETWFSGTQSVTNFCLQIHFTKFLLFFKGASLPILNQLNDPIDRPVEYRPTQNQVYDPR